MKKLICVMLALLMLLALCACGAESAAQTEPAPAEEATAEPAETVTELSAAAAEPAEGAPTQSNIPEEPVAAADQPVPDAAGAADLDLPEGAVVLAFTGDEHGETSGYRVWVEDQVATYGDSLVMLNYSGDVCEKSWDSSVFDTFLGILEELVPGKYNVTTGNQEWKSGAPGATWDDLGDGFTLIGEAAATEDYIVYDIGAPAENYIFADYELEAIAEYLAAAPTDIPIFVLSHYPLHLAMATDAHGIPASDHRQTENNDKLIEILNNYPNVIFLWGHNHTFQDPRYGVLCGAGAEMSWSYEDPTALAEINFTYANYGSFCRGDSYGLIAQVLRTDAGVEVSLYYVDTNVPLTTKDSAVITIAADGTVTTEITEGTGTDYDEILAMSGYAENPGYPENLRG